MHANATHGNLDFRTLLEGVPDSYLILDPALVIVGVTDAYARATMTRREDILGRGLFEVFPDNPDDPAAEGVRNLRASLQRVCQTLVPDAMSVQKYDIRKPEAEGGGFDERYWSPLNTPILGPDGQLAYLIHRVEDVTEFVRLKQQGIEQGRLNEALRERAVRMETEVFARAREVAAASARLKNANEELERLYARTRELDELKTRFFANVSHELRTPLTLILGPLTRLLTAAEPGSDTQRQLERIDRNARQLYRHVSDLLDVARLEAGRMDIHYARVDLARLVRLTASNFESRAEEKHLRYVVAADGSLLAEVDAEKCQRILLNLLGNAFKFVPDGRAITLKLAGSDNHVLLTVSDTGPGIPARLREHIFERFRQGDDSARRDHGGTGLGLSIVREFAVLHGGRVSVTETPGGGACFTVELPRHAPAGTVLHAQASTLDEILGAPVPHARQPASPHRATPDADAPLILVVEDHPDMNTYLAELLGREYRVVTAHDGREGYDRALALRPCLILSDVMMPQMSGDQMVSALRRLPEMADTPIVMLTAKADDLMRVKLLRDGVQDYINKPFSETELLTRIASLIVGRHKHTTELRDRESRLRIADAVYTSTQEGIMVTDLNATLVAVNPAFTAITEYTEAEAIGHNARLLKSDRQDVCFYQQMWHAIRTSGSWQGEMWNRRKSGELYPQWLCINAVHDESGEVSRFVGVFTDLTRLKRAHHVEHLAHHDALTDLPNRLLLMSRLNHALGRIRRHGGHGAVLFIDLDRFKPVNDRFGHAAGDELLRLVATRLLTRLRDGDTLARLGGDEFVVVLEDLAEHSEAATVATDLIRLLNQPFVLSDTRTLNIGGSIGISRFPDDGDEADLLIRKADDALYRAKAAGRNTCRYFDGT